MAVGTPPAASLLRALPCDRPRPPHALALRTPPRFSLLAAPEPRQRRRHAQRQVFQTALSQRFWCSCNLTPAHSQYPLRFFGSGAVRRQRNDPSIAPTRGEANRWAAPRASANCVCAAADANVSMLANACGLSRATRWRPDARCVPTCSAARMPARTPACQRPGLTRTLGHGALRSMLHQARHAMAWPFGKSARGGPRGNKLAK